MPNYQMAKRLADELHTEFGYARPPIDPEVIAQGLGVEVVYAEFGGDFDKSVSGFIEVEPPRIVVNSRMGTARKTFTIAHELGHYLMHMEYARSQDYQVMPRLNDYDAVGKSDEEKEADVFAASLLVPLDMLSHYRRLVPVSELPKLFLVSPQVIQNRLKWLQGEPA